MPDFPSTATIPAYSPAKVTATASAVWSALTRNRRFLVVLAVIVAVLIGVSLANKYGPSNTGIFLEPAVALALILLARRHGLSWHDLGMSRRTWARGIRYALIAIAAVTVLYAIAAVLPFTRTAFVDGRYQLHTGAALLTALVFIPLGTILLEEIAFRGVLLGMLGKRKGTTLAITISSVLFGAWHILPSLALGANRLVAGVFGDGPLAKLAMIAAVVAFTGLAGWVLCEVRHRSGSIIATAGLHWATNGLGVLLTSALWSFRIA